LNNQHIDTILAAGALENHKSIHLKTTIKNNLFILLWVVAGITVQLPARAQRDFNPPNLPKYDVQPYHFGFQISINQMFFTINTIGNMPEYIIPYSSEKFPDITPSYQSETSGRYYLRSGSVYSLESMPRLGFTISIIGNLRLMEYFDLRFIPSLAFGERQLVYDLNLNYVSSETLPTPDTSMRAIMKKSVTSTYLEFPLYIKYKAKRLHNYSPYIIAGAKYSIDLASEARKNKDEINNKHIKLFRSDIFGDIGVGVDFYNNWFKLGVELKMSYGVRDMLRREDNIYTDVIDGLNAKIFTLGVTFE